MVEKDLLIKADDFFAWISENYVSMIEFQKISFSSGPRIIEPVESYFLKDKEEITGKLFLLSIDKEDQSIGYCYLKTGDKVQKIIINNPEKIFTKWEKDHKITFYEMVSILRLDEGNEVNYHLKYLTNEREEYNIQMTEHMWNFIQSQDPGQLKKAYWIE